MKQIVIRYVMMAAFVLTVSAAALTVSTAPTASAATSRISTVCNGKGKLLTFPPWYRGLLDKDCNIVSPDDSGVGGISGFIWKIVLNIIEMVLQLVGYLSVAFIIVGGFKYMTSAGSADGMVKARKTIFNAIIGLVISIASVAIVNVIAGALK